MSEADLRQRVQTLFESGAHETFQKAPKTMGKTITM
jgi:hypothetical protein